PTAAPGVPPCAVMAGIGAVIVQNVPLVKPVAPQLKFARGLTNAHDSTQCAGLTTLKLLLASELRQIAFFYVPEAPCFPGSVSRPRVHLDNMGVHPGMGRFERFDVPVLLAVITPDFTDPMFHFPTSSIKRCRRTLVYFCSSTIALIAFSRSSLLRISSSALCSASKCWVPAAYASAI